MTTVKLVLLMGILVPAAVAFFMGAGFGLAWIEDTYGKGYAVAGIWIFAVSICLIAAVWIDIREKKREENR